MTENRTKRFVLSLLFGIGISVSQAQNSVATLEYWLDADYASRKTVNTDGTFAQEIDVSSLCNGVHTIAMRVSDTEGRWGSPLFRHFLKTAPMNVGNQLAKYEYWIDCDYKNATSGTLTSSTLDLDIDISSLCKGLHTVQMNVSDTHGRISQTMFSHFLTFSDKSAKKLTHYEYWIDDYSNMKLGATSDGNIQLDIDVSSLCKGLHTLSYQVQDDNGRKSAPRFVHFIIPELESGAGMIAAYEYWFNNGPRTRVELQPAAPTLSLDNVVIEVKNVIPNSLDGYSFDTATEQVTVDDNVLFGMQVYDEGNRGSLAAESETFPMVVPVALNMLQLESNGEPQTVDAPTSGRMQGLKSTTAVGDSLIYTLSAQGVTADFYDATGNRLEVKKTLLETGETVYALAATTTCTYMLLYGASDVLTTLDVSLTAKTPSAINSALSDDVTEMTRYNINGQMIGSKKTGVNIIRMSDGSVRKVIVK